MNFKRNAIYIIFSMALVLRLLLLGATFKDNNRVNYVEDVSIAKNLLASKGYSYNYSVDKTDPSFIYSEHPRSTSVKPPVYPLFLVLVFKVFGMKNFLALYILHAVLSSFTCIFIYLGIRIYSERVAAVSGLVVAFYPSFIYHSVAHLVESTTLLLFLVSLFFYVAILAINKFRSAYIYFLGIIGSFTIMTEPVMFPVIIGIFLIIAYINSSNNFFSLPQLLTMVCILIILCLPWTIRNYIVFDNFVFLKTPFGSNIYEGLIRSSLISDRDHKLLIDEIKKLHAENINEAQEDKHVTKFVFSWIMNNRIIFLRNIKNNFINFWWESNRYKVRKDLQYLLGRKVPYILLLFGSIPSFFFRVSRLSSDKQKIKNNFPYYFGLLVIGSYTVVYSIFGAWNLRFHFPVELFLTIFFAESLIFILHAYKRNYFE